MDNQRDQIDGYNESDRLDNEQEKCLDKAILNKLLAKLYYNKAISLENLCRINEAAKFYDMASNVKFINEEFYYKVLGAKAIMYSNDSQEYKALEIYNEIISELEKDIDKLSD